MSFNKLIAVGRLGRDPEMRFTPQGTPVCTFSLATNERRKNSLGEQQDITVWFRVTVWGKQAETAAKFLTKGRSVYVEGRLRVEEWSDKEGKTRHSLEVTASDIQFIDSAQDGARDGAVTTNAPARPYDRAGSGRGARTAGQQPRAADIDEDSIPF